MKLWIAALGILLCCFGCRAPAPSKTPESNPVLALRVWGRLEKGPEGALLRWCFAVENHGAAPVLVSAKRYSLGYGYKTPDAAGGGSWGVPFQLGIDEIYQLLPPVSADRSPRIPGETLTHQGVQVTDNLAPEYLEHVTVSVTIPVLEMSIAPESGQMLHHDLSVELKARLEPWPEE